MDTINHIIKHKLVPVFFHSDEEWCKQVMETCYKAGIRVFEFTNRGPKALQNFIALDIIRRQYYPDMVLGAGTVLTHQAASDFVDAGASFIVSPCFIQDVMGICEKKSIPYLPGCMTIKEIFDATAAGCKMVKIFPGDVVNIGFVKAAKAVLPDIKIMVTGGVNNENLSNWLSAGTQAVGLGSNYFENQVSDALATIKNKIDAALKTAV